MTATDPAREIEAILQRGIGLDVHSIGPSLVTMAVQSRIKKRGMHGEGEYAALLAGSEAEFQALVEEIVVPETWFFRDSEAFALLGRWVSDQWLPAHAFGALRILSAPCSTGEEPYSIVMALLGAGIAPDRFSIEAVDISAVALEKARRAVYGRNSFRGEALGFRDDYFQKTAEGWRLEESVARQVHFRQVNVIDPGFTHKDGELDVVFCRNLLIYFDAVARSAVLTKLARMLSPAGLLFLGHAEGGLAAEFGFEPVGAPMSFAFRKARPRSASAPVSRKPRGLRPPPPVPAIELPKPPVPKPKPPRPAPIQAAPAAKESPETQMARAQQLADAGAFGEARAVCQSLLQDCGSSARIFYLLALIEDAAGAGDQAEAWYRKALYLEPDHYEALIQLSLLEQKQGNTKAARQLEERARRVRAKQESKTGPIR